MASTATSLSSYWGNHYNDEASTSYHYSPGYCVYYDGTTTSPMISSYTIPLVSKYIEPFSRRERWIWTQYQKSRQIHLWQQSNHHTRWLKQSKNSLV